MNSDAYFAGLARYHAWATARLLDESNLASLSDEEWHRDCGLFFRSVHRTVNHLLVTDNIWHARFAEKHSLRMALDTELHRERGATSATHRIGPGRGFRVPARVELERVVESSGLVGLVGGVALRERISKIAVRLVCVGERESSVVVIGTRVHLRFERLDRAAEAFGRPREAGAQSSIGQTLRVYAGGGSGARETWECQQHRPCGGLAMGAEELG